jgi:hypothetical protein
VTGAHTSEGSGFSAVPRTFTATTRHDTTRGLGSPTHISPRLPGSSTSPESAVTTTTREAEALQLLGAGFQKLPRPWPTCSGYALVHFFFQRALDWMLISAMRLRAPLVDLGRATFSRRYFPRVLEFWIRVSRISPAPRCSGRD